MADEEESVVLKGSDLYNYLCGQYPGEFHYYVKREMDRDEQSLFGRVADVNPETKVPICYLNYLDSILKSSVLLDDDVSFLYSYTVDLVSSPQSSRILLTVFESVISLSSLTILPLVCSSLDSVVISDLIRISSGFYIEKRRQLKIDRLLSLLKKIHFYVKKIVQTITEENTLIRIMEMKRKSTEHSDVHSSLNDKKKQELELLKEVVAQNIVKHIEATKNLTLYIYNTMPLHFVDSEDHYLAWCSDRQLGIGKSRSVNKSSPSHPSHSIEALLNIYILMQSEMLRRLGLCFCPTLWSAGEDSKKLSDIFEGTDQYFKSCCSILQNLQFYYKRHILPPIAEKKKLKDYSMIEGYHLVHKLSLTLSNLVKESQDLEGFMERSNCISENCAKLMIQRLERIKIGLNECNLNLNLCDKYFSQKINRDLKREENLIKPTVPVESKDDDVSLQVGKTDLRVSGEDKVFYGVTEGEEGGSCHKIVEPDEESVQMPAFVMSELRQALLSKKTEFEKREENAVAADPNYGAFAATEIPLPLPRSLPVPIPNAKQLPESALGIDLQKSIAMKAANLSSQFVIRKEECFGSSDESD